MKMKTILTKLCSVAAICFALGGAENLQADVTVTPSGTGTGISLDASSQAVTPTTAFKLQNIVVSEGQVADLKVGPFFLTAPTGFEFTTTNTITITTNVHTGSSGALLELSN